MPSEDRDAEEQSPSHSGIQELCHLGCWLDHVQSIPLLSWPSTLILVVCAEGINQRKWFLLPKLSRRRRNTQQWEIGQSNGLYISMRAWVWATSPGSGRSPGEENGNPLQYSCLEDTKDRGVWLATVHGAAKNWTLFAYTQIYECFGSTTSICCHVFLRSHNLNRIWKGKKIWHWKMNFPGQFSSVDQLCSTLWDPMDCSQDSLSINNSWSLLTLMSIELVMPSNHLILCPLLFLPSIFPASGSFSVNQFFASGGQVLEFQLQHQSFQWIFRTDFL